MFENKTEKDMDNMLRIGITGGIGSGKSTFSEIVRERGYQVIDADALAKELMVKDKNLKKKIISAFGGKTYNPDQTLNRKYLAEKVFTSKENVEKINSIVHPAVKKETSRLMEKYLKQNNLVFTEAALIFEADMAKMFDYVILVTASEEDKIKRIMERSGLSSDDVKKRMENQAPDESKKNRASFVLENNGSLEEFKSKAQFFIRLLENIASGTIQPK